MENEKLQFGDRIRAKKDAVIDSAFKKVDYCLLGYDEFAFRLVEWDKRGSYDCLRISGDVNKYFERIDVIPDPKPKPRYLMGV